MGQKLNPTGLRIGVIKNWESRWELQSESGYDYYEDIKKLINKLNAKKYFSHNLKHVMKKMTGVHQYVLTADQRALKRPYLRQKIIA